MECVSRGKFQDALEMLHIKMHNTCSIYFKKEKAPVSVSLLKIGKGSYRATWMSVGEYLGIEIFPLRFDSLIKAISGNHD